MFNGLNVSTFIYQSLYIYIYNYQVAKKSLDGEFESHILATDHVVNESKCKERKFIANDFSLFLNDEFDVCRSLKMLIVTCKHAQDLITIDICPNRSKSWCNHALGVVERSKGVM